MGLIKLVDFSRLVGRSNMTSPVITYIASIGVFYNTNPRYYVVLFDKSTIRLDDHGKPVVITSVVTNGTYFRYYDGYYFFLML